MASRRRKDRRTILSEVLTLRMSDEEMLRFKMAALALGRKRAAIVRERVADLIRPLPSCSPSQTAARGTGPDGAAINGKTPVHTVINGTVAKGAANGESVTATSLEGATGRAR